jgi:DnaJ family protein C protein 3
MLIDALGADAKNYQAFYKRATAYLALGRTKQAVKDLNVVLNFDPAFSQARKRRAELHAKHGKFDAAKEDYMTLVRPITCSLSSPE